ncbi:hypothetical protein ACF3NV_06135 [Moraxella atlantae]|uniref:hypothetical protein n=1 Tax=Faucicola atlantae TaxID=34059 RepID=UPI003752E9B0
MNALRLGAKFAPACCWCWLRSSWLTQHANRRLPTSRMMPMIHDANDNSTRTINHVLLTASVYCQ